MNIFLHCSEVESVCTDNSINKYVSGLLSNMIKKRNEKKYDDIISLIHLPECQYDDKYHYGIKLYSQSEIKNNDYACRKKYDIAQVFPVSDKTKNTVFTDGIIKYITDEKIIPESPEILQNNVICEEKTEITPAEDNNYISNDTCTGDEIPVTDTMSELPELPVFLNSLSAVVSPEIKQPVLLYHEQGREAQDKVPQAFYHSGENRGSPEYSRTDYYCSYHFRQKYQPPEPVYIYREKPGYFKLETHHEPLKRHLKAIAGINEIDNIDIL